MLALASRSVRAIASPTSSGTCDPPGASRNAKSPRSDEKRSRTAATSMVVRSVSVIGSVLSRAGAPASAQIAIESRFPLQDQSAFLAWHSAQWFDQRTFGRTGGFEFSSAAVEIYRAKFRIEMKGPSMKGTVAIAATALGA